MKDGSLCAGVVRRHTDDAAASYPTTNARYRGKSDYYCSATDLRFISVAASVAARLDSHGSYHADLATEDRDVDESRFIVGGEADGLGDAPGHHLRRRMPSVVRIDNLPPQVKHGI